MILLFGACHFRNGWSLLLASLFIIAMSVIDLFALWLGVAVF